MQGLEVLLASFIVCIFLYFLEGILIAGMCAAEIPSKQRINIICLFSV
jgi:hypothetical protein